MMALPNWSRSVGLVYSIFLLSGCVQDIDAGGTGGGGGVAGSGQSSSESCHGGAGGGQGGAGGYGGGLAGAGGGACVPGETRSCYSGPPGTMGVGQCLAGTEVCSGIGLWSGPCQGEVVPAPENCATPEDEDCDGSGTCSIPACTSHDDCPGGRCVFSTGACAVACDVATGCWPGQVCNGCATSSCPDCDDCLSACVPE